MAADLKKMLDNPGAIFPPAFLNGDDHGGHDSKALALGLGLGLGLGIPILLLIGFLLYRRSGQVINPA